MIRRLFNSILVSIILISLNIIGQAHGGLFGPDYTSLIVDLKTNFIPGEEFTSVKITVDGGIERFRDVNETSETLEGIRIAEYELVQNRIYRVKVELLRPDGGVLDYGTRTIAVSLRSNNLAVTAVISRRTPPTDDPPEDAPVEARLIEGAISPGIMREITSPSGGSLGAPGILDQGFVIRDLSEEPAEVGDTPPPVDSREPTAEEPSLEDLVHGDLEREEPARAEFRVPHEGDGDGEPPLDDEDKEAVLSLFELPADEESSSGGGQAIDGQDSRGAASNEVMGGGLSCSLHTPSQGEALDILFLFLVALVVIPSLKGSKLRLG